MMIEPDTGSKILFCRSFSAQINVTQLQSQHIQGLQGKENSFIEVRGIVKSGQERAANEFQEITKIGKLSSYPILIYRPAAI